MIKLIKSSFYHETETKQALAEFILNSEILSMNEQCRKFEKAFAAKQERKHAVYVGNGSVANTLLIQALLNAGTLKVGDKVGFSALTWPTNVMPLIQLGLVPVAIDCELATLNVSPARLSEYIDDLSGLFITNVLGFCDDLPGVRQLCDEKGVVLIEDNCESLGSRVGGKLLGNFGVASTFSFFVGHHLSTIEGGMICTDDDELFEKMVMSRGMVGTGICPPREKWRCVPRPVSTIFTPTTLSTICIELPAHRDQRIHRQHSDRILGRDRRKACTEFRTVQRSAFRE